LSTPGAQVSRATVTSFIGPGTGDIFTGQRQAPQGIPDGVPDQAGQHGQEQGEREGEAARRGEGAGGEEDRGADLGEPELLAEDDPEEDEVAASEEELQGLAHAPLDARRARIGAGPRPGRARPGYCGEALRAPGEGPDDRRPRPGDHGRGLPDAP